MSNSDEFKSEIAVGISAYASDCDGFEGIVKQRFSDFVVRECNLQGSVARLNDMKCPEIEEISRIPEPKEKEDKTEGRGTEEEEEAETSSTDDKVAKSLGKLQQIGVNLDGADQKENLIAFLIDVFEKKEDGKKELVAFQCTTKSVRTAIHQCLKENPLRKFIIAETITIADGSTGWFRLKALHLMKNGTMAREGGGGSNRRNSTFPKDLPPYLKFVLAKENIDTMSACNYISKILRAKPNSIQYAGTKVKRGATAQWCTIYRKRPSDFARINQAHRPLVRVGDFEYVEDPVALGSLSGNRFELVLRDITAQPQTVRLACESLQANGFVNYFGMQRFGSGGTSSHDMGRQILKSNYKGVVEMMFRRKPNDRKDIAAAKDAFSSQQYDKALEQLPPSFYAERQVMQALDRDPTNFANAYQSVSKNTRLICIHAYQSYLWNSAASLRVQTLGMKIALGDLVILKSTPDQIVDDFSADAEVHAIEEEDILAGRWGLRDVVLPLPGHAVQLPKNQIGDMYNQMLEKDGFSLSYFKTTAPPQYRSSGAYRRLIQTATDFEWKTVNYSSINEDIASTELSSGATETSNQDKKNLLALQLGFTLPPGTYATMLLREITKQPTDKDFQSGLTIKRANEEADNQQTLAADESSNPPLKKQHLET